VSLETVRKWLAEFHDNKEVHIVEWKRSANGSRVPKYAAGAGADAVPISDKERIVAAMPATVEEAISQTKISFRGASRLIRELHADRECYVLEWVGAVNGVLVPRYAAGSGVDATKSRHDVSVRYDSEHRKAVRDALPGRVEEIHDKTGFKMHTVRKWVRDLHERDEAHISDWVKLPNRRYVAVYSAGPGQDAICETVPADLRAEGKFSAPPRVADLAYDLLPGTAIDIQGKTGLSRSAVRRALAGLHAKEKIHVSGWHQHSKHTKALPIYAQGAGEDALEEKPIRTPARDMTAEKLEARRLETLALMPATLSELRQKLRVLPATIRTILAQLQEAERCHIADWVRVGNNHNVAVYAAGKGEDVVIGSTYHLVIQSLPGTVNELSERSGVSEPHVRKTIRRLVAKGECHVASWVTIASGHRVPSYAAGDGDAAEDGTTSYRQRVKVALPGYAGSISEMTGIGWDTTHRWLTKLHESGECYISSWIRLASHALVPVYSLRIADEVDVPKPTVAESVLSCLPATADEVAVKLGVGKKKVLRELVLKHQAGECHVIAWGNNAAGVRTPTYQIGKGVDAEFSPYRDMVKAALPGRVDTISAALKIRQETVRVWLRDLHDKGECHIESWAQLMNSRYVPRYVSGPGTDATCEFIAPAASMAGVIRVTPPSAKDVILALLPGSVYSISKKTTYTRQAISNALRSLHADRKVHIKAWKAHPNTGLRIPVYAAGEGQDAECKEKRMSMSILSYLPGTAGEIAQKARVSRDAVLRQLTKRRKAGECHIGSWCSRSGGGRSAIYQKGKGVDAPLPPYREMEGNLLSYLPAAADEIAAKTGAAIKWVRRQLAIKHKAGECHIIMWSKNSAGENMATYQIGDGVDAVLSPYRDMVKAALPGRVDTISAATNLRPATVRTWLEDLHDKGECHIGGWDQRPNSRHIARYVPGPGVDVPCVSTVPVPLGGARKAATPPTAKQVVMSLLPGTLASICKKSRYTSETVRTTLKSLHEDRKVHIKLWKRHPTTQVKTPVYAAGEGVDAICREQQLAANLLTYLPATPSEIAKKARVPMKTVLRELKKRHRAEECHISSWSGRSGVISSAVYQRGKGVNAPLLPYRDMVKAALPGRVDTIAAALKLKPSTVRGWLEDLHDKGECHIGGWKQLMNSRYVPRYVPGPGMDVPCTVTGYLSVQGTKASTPPTAKQVVMTLLPGSAVTIGAKTSYTSETIRAALKSLHEEGKIHISTWERHPKTLIGTPVYTVGKGYDMPCHIRPLTAKQKARRLAEKKAALAKELRAKAELEQNQRYDPDTIKARKKARAYADLAAKNGDPMILAFFGRTSSNAKKVQSVG
jgi:predicted ArsR family transcriptional regulator/transcription initiation factor IIE alpha subunit